MAKIVWTEEAERWLRKIHDYIAVDKPATAFKVVESIYRRAQILAQFPELGQVYRTPSGRAARILLWGHYRIVYIHRPDDEVHIIGDAPDEVRDGQAARPSQVISVFAERLRG